MFSTTLALLGCTAMSLAAAPAHISELYTVLEAIPNSKLGVLSQGNYDSVHHLVPSETAPVIFEDVGDLILAVKNSSVDAGLINGLPPADAGIGTFTSEYTKCRPPTFILFFIF